MFDAIREAIEVRFNDNWPTASSNVAHTYEGMPQPKDAKTEFVRLVVKSGQGRRASIGTGKWLERHAGAIMLQIFVVPDVGTGRMRALADIAGTFFKDITFDTDEQIDVRIQVGSLDIHGKRDGFLQGTLTFPAEFDFLHGSLSGYQFQDGTQKIFQDGERALFQEQ